MSAAKHSDIKQCKSGNRESNNVLKIREEIKHTMEEGKEKQNQKQLTGCEGKEVNRLLYRLGNKKKFFSEASISLSTV